MKSLVLVGRLFYTAIFIMGSFGHFQSATIGYAASQGVPIASVLVPISGVMSLVGGLSILVGYKAKWGAWILVLFLVPVTIMMHRFWGIADSQAAMMQQIMFTKNVSMLGAALLIAHFGSGPLSVEARTQS